MAASSYLKYFSGIAARGVKSYGSLSYAARDHIALRGCGGINYGFGRVGDYVAGFRGGVSYLDLAVTKATMAPTVPVEATTVLAVAVPTTAAREVSVALVKVCGYGSNQDRGKNCGIDSHP